MRAPNVTTPDSALDGPIRSRDDLLALFHEGAKPKQAFRIGPEMEKFGVVADTLRPIPYEGHGGVLHVLGVLAEQHGWVPESEKPGGPVLALSRGGAQITL